MTRPLFLAMALLTACVPKKDFVALQGDYDSAGQTISDRDTQISSLEQALAAEKSKVEDLDGRLAAMTAERDAKVSELDGLSADHAALLKDRSRLRSSVEEMQQALKELAARKAASELRVKEYQDLLAKFRDLIDAGKLRVQIVDGRMVVVLATDILFASGKADLSDGGKTALTDVGKVLATIDKRYQVEGHTDNVPIKTDRFPSNWELSSARSLVVVRTLIEAGVAPDHISGASYGEFRPLAANDTTEGKASNRRIEIVVVPDLSQLPGFDELTNLAKD